MDKTRRVWVGLIEDSEVVACSEESVERHKIWNHASTRGPTWGDLRASGLIDVDEYWAENWEDDEKPTDTDLIEYSSPLLDDGDLDWSPSEQTVNEFGELLRDLGVQDAGVGMFYTPVEFVIPKGRQQDAVERLRSAGYEVAVIDGDFGRVWWS